MGRQHSKPGPRQLTIFEHAHTTGDAGRRPVSYPGGGFRPDLRHGLAWCPYCGTITLFAWDPRLKEPRCPGCSISASDYYVAHINRLSTDIACGAFAAAVRRAGLVFDRPLFFEKRDRP